MTLRLPRLLSARASPRCCDSIETNEDSARAGWCASAMATPYSLSPVTPEVASVARADATVASVNRTHSAWRHSPRMRIASLLWHPLPDVTATRPDGDTTPLP